MHFIVFFFSNEFNNFNKQEHECQIQFITLHLHYLKSHFVTWKRQFQPSFTQRKMDGFSLRY